MNRKFVPKNIGLIILASILLLMLGQMMLASLRAERYASAAAMVLGTILFVGVFISARSSSTKQPEGRFQPLRPWKTPYETTRMGLWLRAAFLSVAGFIIFIVVGFGIRAIDGGELPYISRNSFQFLVLAPFLYWHARRQYFPVSPEEQPAGENLLLRHSDEPRQSSGRETAAIILGTVAAMLIVTIFTDWLI